MRPCNETSTSQAHGVEMTVACLACCSAMWCKAQAQNRDGLSDTQMAGLRSGNCGPLNMAGSWGIMVAMHRPHRGACLGMRSLQRREREGTGLNAQGGACPEFITVPGRTPEALTDDEPERMQMNLLLRADGRLPSKARMLAV